MEVLVEVLKYVTYVLVVFSVVFVIIRRNYLYPSNSLLLFFGLGGVIASARGNSMFNMFLMLLCDAVVFISVLFIMKDIRKFRNKAAE
ncbi:hypothetical protein [Bacillus rhizoplanae]|uniref:hypothetical protein n=1 Tax=Bacillus rhizoplanae TaxID=2880966 RepID=UPI003D1D4CDB